MISLRKISSAILLVSIAFAFGAVSVHGAPEAQNTVATATNLIPLLSTLLNTANTIGNDPVLHC